ncbi:MAG TPA: hypothetical protein VFW64_16695 [Pseudonocardiaceae bacterium]|nr:hypothetical protein [Pseudonocardiaceae bacterium]
MREGEKYHQASDARLFVEFLDAANALPDVQTLTAVMVDELRLSPGVRVREVGCGTGDDARLLAALVGQDGWFRPRRRACVEIPGRRVRRLPVRARAHARRR